VKKIIVIPFLFFCPLFILAQDEADTYEAPGKGFQKDHLFIGSGLALGIGSGTFNVGANPEVGYSIAKWLDAGLGFNLNYYSISGDYNYGIKQTSFNYGGGPFLRIYPFPFLFIQGLYEHNWIDYTLKYETTGQTDKFTTTSNSILAGIGYSQRVVGQMNFYTVLLFDLGNDANSPYKDSYGSSYPILRAGFNFYLRPRQR
jgi:hypothetical protein